MVAASPRNGKQNKNMKQISMTIPSEEDSNNNAQMGKSPIRLRSFSAKPNRRNNLPEIVLNNAHSDVSVQTGQPPLKSVAVQNSPIATKAKSLMNQPAKKSTRKVNTPQIVDNTPTVPNRSIAAAVADQDILVTVHAPDDEFGDSDIESDDEVPDEAADVTDPGANVTDPGDRDTDSPIPDRGREAREKFKQSIRDDPELRQMLNEMVEESIQGRGKQHNKHARRRNNTTMLRGHGVFRDDKSNAHDDNMFNGNVIQSPSESTIYMPALQ